MLMIDKYVAGVIDSNTIGPTYNLIQIKIENLTRLYQDNHHQNYINA